MTDKKISEFTNITGANVDDANDELTIVDSSEATTKAITREELFKSIDGDITLSGTVDGRDVAADGTKLDGIEASADVTDTANVTAAGALMDSELTDIAAVKGLDQGVATTDSPTFAGATLTADLTIPDKIIHAGDTDTAIRFSAADTVTVETGGSERLRVDSNGNLGIGGASPDSITKLYTAGTGTQLVVLESTDGGAMQLRFKSDSGNRRFLAVDNADNNEAQVVFENDHIALAGPTTSLDTWLKAEDELVTVQGAVKYGSYTVATLPSASTLGAGSMIFVSDETGGATMAFSDGTDWRRVQDRAVVS